jgi:hypothetical protein
MSVKRCSLDEKDYDSLKRALSQAQDVAFSLQESWVEDVAAYDLNGDYCPAEDERTLLEVIDFLHGLLIQFDLQESRRQQGIRRWIKVLQGK